MYTWPAPWARPNPTGNGWNWSSVPSRQRDAHVSDRVFIAGGGETCGPVDPAAHGGVRGGDSGARTDAGRSIASHSRPSGGHRLRPRPSFHENPHGGRLSPALADLSLRVLRALYCTGAPP